MVCVFVGVYVCEGERESVSSLCVLVCVCARERGLWPHNWFWRHAPSLDRPSCPPKSVAWPPQALTGSKTFLLGILVIASLLYALCYKLVIIACICCCVPLATAITYKSIYVPALRPHNNIERPSGLPKQGCSPKGCRK